MKKLQAIAAVQQQLKRKPGGTSSSSSSSAFSASAADSLANPQLNPDAIASAVVAASAPDAASLPEQRTGQTAADNQTAFETNQRVADIQENAASEFLSEQHLAAAAPNSSLVRTTGKNFASRAMKRVPTHPVMETQSESES